MFCGSRGAGTGAQPWFSRGFEYSDRWGIGSNFLWAKSTPRLVNYIGNICHIQILLEDANLPHPPALVKLPSPSPFARRYLKEIELRPRTAITFTFRGSNSTVGRLSESLCCETRVGKEKQTRQVFKVIKKSSEDSPIEFSEVLVCRCILVQSSLNVT